MSKKCDSDFIRSSISTRDLRIPRCVEVKRGPDSVLLRDSKKPDVAPLEFSHDEWKAFIGGAKAGEFDL